MFHPWTGDWPVAPFPSNYDWHKHYPNHFAPLPTGDAAAAAAPADAAAGEAAAPEAMKHPYFPGTLPAEGSSKAQVTFADVGCGYGGLLMELSPLFPEKLMIGMEIRDKVTEYVAQKVLALRAEHPGQYQNVSVVQTNAMKHMANFFEKGQLEKLFFLFPDPHFKKAKHRLRIVHRVRLAEHAYFVRPGGLVYTATDVEDLHKWMVEHLTAHPLFERAPDCEDMNDPVVKAVMTGTEEGKKVERNKGSKFLAVFRRKPDLH
jgi:tRNA (guanine-N7-)-methyltransferase